MTTTTKELNKNKIQVHLHLWYEEESIYLIDKIHKGWKGKRINVSFNTDGKANDRLLNYCQDKFSDVRAVYVENCGNDQVGFFKSIQTNNEEDKEFVLYAHDKNPSKRDWVDQNLDPLVDNADTVNTYLKEDVGMISSANPKRLEPLLSEEKLIAIDKETAMSEKKGVVLARQTLIWLRELQYILYDVHGYIDKDRLNFKFTAGNMFIISKDVLEVSQSVVHPNFFPEAYREDGDMPHALERFYYYVSLCMKKQNIFI